MAHYVDGFLLPLPKKNLPLYKRMATMAGKLWMEHGALQYMECLGDDLLPKGVKYTFAKAAGCKAGETVIFSWIVYRNRKHRDQVIKKVMGDPRLEKWYKANVKQSPFDMERMAFAGFTGLVEKGW